MSRSSFAKALFLPVAGVVSLGLLVSFLVSSNLIRRTVSDSLAERFRTTQNLFVSNIESDLLNGAFSEVYRKCRMFFDDPAVESLRIRSQGGDQICDFRKPSNGASGLSLSSEIFFDEAGAHLFGTVQVEYDDQLGSRLREQSLRVLLVTLLALLVLLLFASRIFTRRVSRPLEEISGIMRAANLEELTTLSRTANATSITELAHFAEETSNLASKLIESQNREVQSARESALGELASQVAHDIRSPLAALGALEKDLAALPEDARLLARSAVGRIKDIANNLLAQYKMGMNKEDGGPSHEEASPQLLSGLIEPLISEKRLQLRSRGGIQLDVAWDSDTYGLFANVEPTQFKRVISNLINNAAEAITDVGNITVSLELSDRQALISIQDTGRGIPPEILLQLGAKGVTHDKVGGTGLGLYFAKSKIEGWGGELALQSVSGEGTTVVIKIPVIPHPRWFLPELVLTEKGSVVVMDDDESIHQTWRARFQALKVAEHGIEVLHFTNPDEFSVSRPDHLFLMDYEFVGHAENGIDLIQRLGIASSSVLVTSRYQEILSSSIFEKSCLRLIPKGLAAQVPIRIETART